LLDLPSLKKRRTELQKENQQLEQQLARVKELKSKRNEEIKVKLKMKINAEQKKNRELKAQLEAITACDSDGDISD
jgi:hypothetical protein